MAWEHTGRQRSANGTKKGGAPWQSIIPGERPRETGLRLPLPKDAMTYVRPAVGYKTGRTSEQFPNEQDRKFQALGVPNGGILHVVYAIPRRLQRQMFGDFLS